VVAKSLLGNAVSMNLWACTSLRWFNAASAPAHRGRGSAVAFADAAAAGQAAFVGYMPCLLAALEFTARFGAMCLQSTLRRGGPWAPRWLSIEFFSAGLVGGGIAGMRGAVGVASSREIEEPKRKKRRSVAYTFIIPNINATARILVAHTYGVLNHPKLDSGMAPSSPALCDSATIDAHAGSRLMTLPDAGPTVPRGSMLGLTFPYNETNGFGFQRPFRNAWRAFPRIPIAVN
jgi:hypothetical protein